MLSDLTEIFDVRVGLYHWVNFLIPIRLIDAVHFGRDLEWHASFHGDFDCPVGPFFWGDAAKKGEITTGRLRPKRQNIAR